MLREIGTWVMGVLESKFTHIEFYEGQFERFDQIVVNPPTCYVNYGDIESGQVFDPLGTVYLTLHLITSKLDRDPESMLELVEEVVDMVNNQAVRYHTEFEKYPLPEVPTGYVGRCFFNRCRNNVSFKGLLVWDVELRVERT
jgi:hypothetical protein